MEPEKTIFQKIIDREIPADIVYEDDVCIAFLDIRPTTLGHTLVITKNVYQWMDDVPDAELAHAFIVAKKIIKSMKQNLENINLVCVVVVGEEVPHFHIKLMPQNTSEPLAIGQTRQTTYTDDAQKQEYVEKIKKGL